MWVRKFKIADSIGSGRDIPNIFLINHLTTHRWRYEETEGIVKIPKVIIEIEFVLKISMYFYKCHIDLKHVSVWFLCEM